LLKGKEKAAKHEFAEGAEEQVEKKEAVKGKRVRK